MIIDGFAHVLHSGYLDTLAESGGSWTKKKIEDEKKRSAGANTPHMMEVKLRLQHLDKYGIDMQVITPTNYWDIDRFPGDAGERLKNVLLYSIFKKRKINGRSTVTFNKMPSYGFSFNSFC